MWQSPLETQPEILDTSGWPLEASLDDVEALISVGVETEILSVFLRAETKHTLLLVPRDRDGGSEGSEAW